MYQTIDERLEVRCYETSEDVKRKDALLSSQYRNYRTGRIETLGTLFMTYKREMEEYNRTHKRGYFGSFDLWICHNRWDVVK